MTPPFIPKHASIPNQSPRTQSAGSAKHRLNISTTRILCCLLTVVFTRVSIADDAPKQTVIVVVGALGDPEFAEPFRTWADRWKAAAEEGKAEFHCLGLEPEAGVADRDRLKELLAKNTASTPEPLWLVLIGHGTFNGQVARFNMRGPDVSPAELAQWLRPIERPVALADCTSCSAPFLADLSARQRVIITATRSGHEYNLAHFGEFLSSSIRDPAGDLDKDGQTSLLEAFLLTASRTNEFYSSQARLSTEHALLDDNGDKHGTPPDWFKGVRAVKSTKDGSTPDGRLANSFVLVRSPAEAVLTPQQRAKRDDLERKLAQLRARKSELSEDEYLNSLEPVLLELGELLRGRSASSP